MVRLRSGEEIPGDEFVLAVPCERVAAVAPKPLRSHPVVTSLAEIEAAPISSVHLWFDREITELPHAVLVGRLSQWMFNRHRILGRTGDVESFEYQVVISASRMLAGESREDTISRVVGELSEIWPQVAQARLQHARIVTEHRAVFSVKPGTDSLRPVQQSPIPNLQFAGDWTQTGMGRPRWRGRYEAATWPQRTSSAAWAGHGRCCATTCRAAVCHSGCWG